MLVTTQVAAKKKTDKFTYIQCFDKLLLDTNKITEMFSFEECISRIDNEISIQKGDREQYSKDFDCIRDYVMDIMKKTDPVFREIYGGPSLFGSYLDNIKIDVPDEFDVHFLLNLPFYEDIELKLDHLRPGFVKLDISKPLKLMQADGQYNEVFQMFKSFVNGTGFLRRNDIKNWLGNVITEALRTYGNSVTNANGTKYTLSYSKRGTALTFMAFSGHREIDIDFVPAFRFNANYDWFAQREFPKNVKHELWFAVPKPSVGPKRGRKFTFSICVPQVEKDLLTRKYNLKPTLRLLKSLRDKMNGDHRHLMKSYFIKTLFLFENEIQDDSFWMQSPGKLLLHMLDELLVLLKKGYIPSYWCPSMNLLDSLTSSKIRILEQYFSKARNRLDGLSTQKEIKYDGIRKLFGKSTRQLKKENA